MLDLLRSNWPLKALALALAFTIWVAVTGEDRVLHDLSIPLEIELSADQVLASPVPNTVSVRLRGAASLMQALEAGEVDIYKCRQPIRIGKHDGDVTVADDIKGKKIVVSIGGVAKPSRDALTSILSDLGDSKVGVKYVPGAGMLIRKVVRKLPSTPAIGATVQYAEKFVDSLDQVPEEPSAGDAKT